MVPSSQHDEVLFFGSRHYTPRNSVIEGHEPTTVMDGERQEVRIGYLT
jgi:hypothetical protein